MACGIVQIICGGFAALAIPFVLLGALLARKTTGVALPAGTYMMTIVSYTFTAAVLITLGVGSIQARRWARALSLVLSWVWLLGGISITVVITAILPASFMEGFRRAASLNPSAPPPPTIFIAVILTLMIVFFAVFLVVLPLGLVLFYSRKDVEETCKRRDPVERWTDRCPLPVLAVSLLFACASPYHLLSSFTAPLVPFFGHYLTGVPGAVGCLVLFALDAFLALSFFRLRLTGWWVAVAALILRSISAAITNFRGNLLQAYSKMGWGQSQLEAMGSNPVFRSGMILWWSFGFTVLFLGYVIWLRRYFPSAVAPPQSDVLAPTAQ